METILVNGKEREVNPTSPWAWEMMAHWTKQAINSQDGEMTVVYNDGTYEKIPKKGQELKQEVVRKKGLYSGVYFSSKCFPNNSGTGFKPFFDTSEGKMINSVNDILDMEKAGMHYGTPEEQSKIAAHYKKQKDEEILRKVDSTVEALVAKSNVVEEIGKLQDLS